MNTITILPFKCGLELVILTFNPCPNFFYDTLVIKSRLKSITLPVQCCYHMLAYLYRHPYQTYFQVDPCIESASTMNFPLLPQLECPDKLISLESIPNIESHEPVLRQQLDTYTKKVSSVMGKAILQIMGIIVLINFFAKVSAVCSDLLQTFFSFFVLLL